MPDREFVMAEETPVTEPEAEAKPRRKKRSEEDEIQRALRLQIEAEDLKASVNSASLHDLKTRVAWTLNLHPHTRDSDISLALKYWEQFQPELFNSTSLAPKDLFKLERMTNITRVRAKIQNEYNLFTASEGIRHRRRQLEEDVSEQVVDDKPGRNLVHVFADETGKNAEHICVAAVWLLTSHAVWQLSSDILKWKTTSPWATCELHFSDFKRGQEGALRGYLDLIEQNRQFLSFKAISLEKATTRRPVDEVVQRLHEMMLTRGARHEVENNRIGLPHEINLTIDAEQSLDKITCADIKSRVAQEFTTMYGDRLTVGEVTATHSHRDYLVQLADVVAGAINRRKNHRGDRGHKDEMADTIIERLDIQLEPDDIPGLDATVWLSL
jgi:hypothetical protein